MGRGRDMVYAAGLALSAPVWGASLLRSGKWRTDWAGRMGRTNALGAEAARPRGARPRVLVHAVSVGEVNLVRPLVAELARDCDVVVSSTTNTGIARAASVYGERHAVVRFPFDFSGAVGRLLDEIKPDVVALAELEVWPNFVEACVARGVPVCVVNGRLSERSFRGYRRLGPWLRGTFGSLSAVGAQTDAVAERFVAVGVPAERVSVMDTMKWDTARIEDASAVAGSSELAEAMGIDRTRPLVVAGSTAPGEERMLIDGKPAGVQLLIAPRKPEWFGEVVKACPGVVRRTATTGNQTLPPEDRAQRRRQAQQDVFLLDTIGELRLAYALADVVVVGRSFTGKLYGSDMMEPVGLGKPTVIGPHYGDFAAVMAALIAGRGIEVGDRPWEVVDALLADQARAARLAQAGVAVVRSRQGVAVRYAALVRDCLKHNAKRKGGAGDVGLDP